MPAAAKRTLQIICAIIVALAAAVGAYVAYVALSYSRIPDNEQISVEGTAAMGKLEKGASYRALTFNIGFGAYTPDYTFFMDEGAMEDGSATVGEHATCVSEQSAKGTTAASVSLAKQLDADFTLLQETDRDSDRSYHVDQAGAFEQAFEGCSSVYTPNLHTAWLAYPLTDPIGSMNGGLLTLSKYEVKDAVRRSYPISESFPDKFFDLDRCFELMRIPVSGSEHELVLINSHMSAYDAGGEFRTKQLALIGSVMEEEARKGNWVIAGGDWNHALCGSEALYPSKQQTPSWLAVLSDDDLPEGFSVVKAKNIGSVASCRDDDIAYEKGVTYTSTVDGFIVSSNVEAVATNIDNGFKSSDHNPVLLDFKLK